LGTNRKVKKETENKQFQQQKKIVKYKSMLL